MKITIEQINWDGQGNTRTFVKFAEPNRLDEALRNIRLAYNMKHTKVSVSGKVVS